MNVKGLNKNVYNYIFEIDDIKRGLFIYKTNVRRIYSIKFKNSFVKHKLIQLTKDFKVVCNILIRKINIDNAGVYLNYISVLNIINAKVQKILEKERGKNHCDDKEIKILLKSYEKVEKYINGYSSATVFVNNHSTAIILSVVFFIFAFMLFLGYKINDFSIILVMSLTLIVSYILCLIFRKKLENLFNKNRLERIISKNTYIKSRKMTISNKFLEIIATKLINKI